MRLAVRSSSMSACSALATRSILGKLELRRLALSSHLRRRCSSSVVAGACLRCSATLVGHFHRSWSPQKAGVCLRCSAILVDPYTSPNSSPRHLLGNVPSWSSSCASSLTESATFSAPGTCSTLSSCFTSPVVSTLVSFRCTQPYAGALLQCVLQPFSGALPCLALTPRPALTFLGVLPCLAPTLRPALTLQMLIHLMALSGLSDWRDATEIVLCPAP